MNETLSSPAEIPSLAALKTEMDSLLSQIDREGSVFEEYIAQIREKMRVIASLPARVQEAPMLVARSLAQRVRTFDRTISDGSELMEWYAELNQLQNDLILSVQLAEVLTR